MTSNSMEAATKRLEDGLGPTEAGKLRAGMGPGAGAFLSPVAGGSTLADAHFQVALRRRLRCVKVVGNAATRC